MTILGQFSRNFGGFGGNLGEFGGGPERHYSTLKINTLFYIKLSLLFMKNGQINEGLIVFHKKSSKIMYLHSLKTLDNSCKDPAGAMKHNLSKF